MTSVSTSCVPVTPTIPASGSGSVESHLSSAGSHQRLRVPSSFHPNLPLVADSKDEFESISDVTFYTPPSSPHTPSVLATLFRALFSRNDVFPIGTQPMLHSRFWLFTGLKWTIILYCAFSLVFAAVAIYKQLGGMALAHVSTPQAALALDPYRASTSLSNLSTQQRLSRILSFQPPLHTFVPFFVRGVSIEEQTSVTACLWSDDLEASDSSTLVAWAAQWRGPISLLVRTTTLPETTSGKALLERLQSSNAHPSLHRLSVHLLHVNSVAQDTPNAYHNIARLFSTTPLVTIFPWNLSILPPSDLYDSVLSRAPLLSDRPFLLANTEQLSYLSSGVSPVALTVEHSLWCTERFFFSNTRAADWDDCIWQLWLEEFGRLGHINTSISIGFDDPRVPAFAAKTRSRLNVKFRTEACDLRMKRLTISEPQNSTSLKRKLRWLKNFCRETVDTA